MRMWFHLDRCDAIDFDIEMPRPYHPNGGVVMIGIENGKAKVLPGEVKLGFVPGVAAIRRQYEDRRFFDFLTVRCGA